MGRVFRHSLLLTHLLIFFIMAETLQASFTLRVNLYRFRNAQHSKADGFCCDQTNNCSSDCNNRFTVCLHTPHNTTDQCSLGEYQSGYIQQDMITFSEQSIIQTPVIFEVDRNWPGLVEVLVSVEDEQTGDEVRPLVVEVAELVNITHNPAEMQVSSTRVETYGQQKFIEMNFELECSENFFGSECGVYCAPRNDETGHFSCNSTGQIECLNGFTDPSTNCTTCLLSEECSSIGGYCNSTHHCICQDEYGGEFCDQDLNVCRTMEASCLNGGTCVYNSTLQSKFSCRCVEGYDGLTCGIDLDVCEHTSPCQNNGVCVNTGPDSFTCNCTSGYKGERCTMETNQCLQNMCQNGAVCKDLHLDYECVCARGYDGRFCEIELDGCTTELCLNNGTCTNNLGDFICECTQGFSGRYCHIDINPEDPSLSGFLGPIIGGAIASGVLLIIIICLFVVLVYILRQRSRRKLVINSFKEAGNPAARSQQVFSVDNPTLREVDTSLQASTSRFDNPIYDDITQSQSVPTDGHYNHLKPMTGQSSNGHHPVLAPASSSVVELLNSIADYSTLNDSMRTQTTTASSARDHQYEQIGGEQFGHSEQSGDTDSYHDYSRLHHHTQDGTSVQPQDQNESVDLSIQAADQGLPRPYENLESSLSASPDSEAVSSRRDKYDHLVLNSGGKVQSEGVPEVEGGFATSGFHDYDSVECGVYENADNKVVEVVVYANETVSAMTEPEPVYDDTI